MVYAPSAIWPGLVTLEIRETMADVNTIGGTHFDFSFLAVLASSP